MVTLHSYFLRELLKQFILWEAALTGLVTLGGGLYNMLRQQGLQASDLVTIMPWMIPIVITLTMPIAAVLAATMSYGRFAADNEFTALRAAGINVHRMFFAAMLLSIFVAALELVSANFIIPQLSKAIEHYGRKNVRTFVYTQLNMRGYVRMAGAKTPSMLTAQSVKDVPDELLVEKGFAPSEPGLSYLWLVEPRLLLLDNDWELKRYSAAVGGLCQFDTREEKFDITIYLRDATDFEIGRRAARIMEQQVGPFTPDLPLPVKASMLDLFTLYQWRDKPWLDQRSLGQDMDKYLDAARNFLFLKSCLATVERGEPLSLTEMSGKRCEMRYKDHDFGRRGLTLSGVSARLLDAAGAEIERYEAPEVRFIPRTLKNQEPMIEIRLLAKPEAPVRQVYIRNGAELVREKPTVSLDGYKAPREALEMMRTLTPQAVLSDAELPTDERLGEDRPSLRATARNVKLKVDSLVHSRLSYSISALVTVLMGAVLGVMFRGGHPLAAIGLACIPLGVVLILGKTGQNMAAAEKLHIAGIAVMWGILAAMAGADWVMLRLGIRR